MANKQSSDDNDMIVFGYHHLLPVTLPKEYSDKFLGRLVPNRKHPKANYIPDWDINEEGAPSPQTLVLGLSDKPVPYDSLNAVLSNAKSDQAEVRITEILGLRASRNITSTTVVEGIRVERYEMGLIQQKIDKLMAQAQYSEPVIKFLKDQPERSCAMVTGIVVCKELTIRHESKDGRGLGIDASVPLEAVGPAFGVPPIKELNIKTKYDRDRKKNGEEGSTTKEEVVIALAYTKVQLQEVLEESTVPAPKHSEGLHGIFNKMTHKQKETAPQTTTERRYILRALNLNSSNAYMSGLPAVENDKDATVDRDEGEAEVGTEAANTSDMNTETPRDLEGDDQSGNRDTTEAIPERTVAGT